MHSFYPPTFPLLQIITVAANKEHHILPWFSVFSEHVSEPRVLLAFVDQLQDITTAEDHWRAKVPLGVFWVGLE